MSPSQPRRNRGRKRNSVNENETVDALGYHRMIEGKPRHPTHRIGDIIPQILARYGVGRKLSTLRFQAAFSAILSDLFPQEKENGSYTEDSYQIVGLRSGVLQIRVSDAPLLAEFAFYRGEILRRLKKTMPEENIRDVRFTLMSH